MHLDGVELDYVHQERRAKEVPLYIGATGMKMMALAGEIADGAVLNYLVSPAYNERALAALAEGAARAGRTLDDIDRPQLVVCSLDADRDAALDAARLLVTQYLGQQPHIMAASGVPSSLLDEIGEVLTWPATHDQVVAASKLVPDEIVQMLCAAGHRGRVPGQGGRVRGHRLHVADPLPARRRRGDAGGVRPHPLKRLGTAAGYRRRPSPVVVTIGQAGR